MLVWKLLWGREIPYSLKLLRKKTFANFEVSWLFAKVFSAKYGGVVSFSGTSKQSAKFFCTKIFFSTNSQKFSLMKVSHYTVICWCSAITCTADFSWLQLEHAPQLPDPFSWVGAQGYCSLTLHILTLPFIFTIMYESRRTVNNGKDSLTITTDIGANMGGAARTANNALCRSSVSVLSRLQIKTWSKTIC